MRPASISGAAGAQQDKSSRSSGASYSGTQQRQSDAPLVYASPRSLPSYPSVGLRNDAAAAGIAASIGWAAQKDRKEEAELVLPKNLSRSQQQHQHQQQQYPKSPRVRAQHVETTNPSAAAGLIGASASSASLKAAAAAASAALSAPSPSRTPTPSQQQQQQSLSPPSPPAGPSLQRRKSAQSVRSSRSVRSLRPTPPAAAPAQRSRPLSMFAETPHLSIVAEPLTASTGSTSGSSQAAATAALGSASNRHKRSASVEASSAGRMPPSAPSAKASWGNSAATHAFKNSQSANRAGAGSGASLAAPELSSQKLGRQPSLHAAQGAMNTAQKPETGTLGIPSATGMPGTTGAPATRTMRNRAASNPVGGYGHRKSYSSPFPENATTAMGEPAPRPVSNVNANAISAAALAHNAGNSRAGHKMPEGGAVPYTTMNRQMYTSRPPVAPEAEENNIHASALALAKRMYNTQAQQAAARQATADAETESLSDSDAGGGSGGGGVPPFTSSLQEAAYRLAQERLEKLHTEHQSNRGYRDHYVDPNLGAKAAAAAAGSSAADSVSGKGRFALRSRLRRRRSASDSVVMEERRQERDADSGQNRPSLPSRITTDLEKQRRDRQNVLAAAQRNVAAQLHNIDEQIYAETGRAHPSLLASWESKAHSAAEARVAAGTLSGRSLRHHRGSVVIPDTDDNKVSLGGGAFMDRSEVNRIAARRVQPILDEINDKAEKEHLRLAALKQEEDERKQQAELLKTRDREMKDMYHKMKQEEKEEKKAAKEKARTKGAKETGEAKEPSTVDKGKAPLVPIVPERQSHAGNNEDVGPDADDMMVSAVPATAEGVNGTAGKRGSRISKLFVRTSKAQTHRGEFSTGGVAAAEMGGGAKAAAEESGAAASVPSSSAPTSATVASPISPVSEFDDTSPPVSPTSRVRKWLKLRLNRPRSKSTGSAAGAADANGSTGHNGNMASTNTGGHAGDHATSSAHKTVAATGPSAPGTTTAVATTTATTVAAVTTTSATAGAAPGTPVKAPAERSFIGGHALTSAEGTMGGRSTTATPLSATSPLQMPTPAAAVGAGLLSLPDDTMNEAGSSTITHTAGKGEAVGSERPLEAATAATAAPPTTGASTGAADSSTFGGLNGNAADDTSKRFSHASISSYYSNAGASAADSGFAAAKTQPRLEGGGQSSEDAPGTTTVPRADVKSNGATGISSSGTYASDATASSVFKKDVLAPPPSGLHDQTKKSASPVRDSRFLENLEELM